MVVLALGTAGWSILNYLHFYCPKYLFKKRAGRKSPLAITMESVADDPPGKDPGEGKGSTSQLPSPSVLFMQNGSL